MTKLRWALATGAAIAMGVAAWIAADLSLDTRHDLRDFDGHEVGRLETALSSAFAEIAPVQVAEVLRPLGAEARNAAVARALELLKEQQET